MNKRSNFVFNFAPRCDLFTPAYIVRPEKAHWALIRVAKGEKNSTDKTGWVGLPVLGHVVKNVPHRYVPEYLLEHVPKHALK